MIARGVRLTLRGTAARGAAPAVQRAFVSRSAAAASNFHPIAQVQRQAKTLRDSFIRKV